MSADTTRQELVETLTEEELQALARLPALREASRELQRRGGER